MHHLSGAVYHEAVLEGVIALLGNRPLPNQVQFNLDACDVLHQQCEHLLPPLVVQLLLHLFEDDGGIRRRFFDLKGAEP